MKKLIHAAIHRRALMFVLFGMLGVLGYFSWRGLAIDAYPDIADVTVQVVTQVPGLAAEEIEQQISIPMSNCRTMPFRDSIRSPRRPVKFSGISSRVRRTTCAS